MRDDGVYVAAGVELIEPASRHTMTPARIARVSDRLGWQTAKPLREATDDPDNGSTAVRYRMPLVLKVCHCAVVFVGGARSRYCPACARSAVLASVRAAVGRYRAKMPPVAESCRHCGEPISAKRSTKTFCSEKCRVAAHRQGHGRTSQIEVKLNVDPR